jgi:hypothetical protein
MSFTMATRFRSIEKFRGTLYDSYLQHIYEGSGPGVHRCAYRGRFAKLGEFAKLDR